MTFEFQQQTLMEGILAFPSYPFVPLPKQPSEVIETILIMGSSSTAQAITGIVDDPEG